MTEQTTYTTEQIMEQAQVFASAWSLVGGCFDSGDQLEVAKQEKTELRAMLEAHTGTARGDAPAAPIAAQEPVAWGAFYFGGKWDGKLYGHAYTEAQIDAYILDVHRCSDSVTLRKGPLYTEQPADQPDTQAARDVLAERRRQVEAEGWTPKHDDEYCDGQMSAAAASYALDACGIAMGHSSHKSPPAIWPWAVLWWKPAGARRNLVKAAALILAEIERLDRALLGKEASHA